MSESESFEENSHQESFYEYVSKNIDLSCFPDPIDSLCSDDKLLTSPELFIQYWKETYNQTITGFRSFNGKIVNLK
jgi:hypothetical protein